MTSWDGNISALLAFCAGNSPVNSPHIGQWRGALMFSLICAWIKGWINSREAGDLRRKRAHYDVIVMNRRQADTWTNGDPFYWLIYACLWRPTCSLTIIGILIKQIRRDLHRFIYINWISIPGKAAIILSQIWMVNDGTWGQTLFMIVPLCLVQLNALCCNANAYKCCKLRSIMCWRNSLGFNSLTPGR